MKTKRTHRLLAPLAFAGACLPFNLSTAADAPVPAKATVKEAMGSAVEISREVKAIESRLLAIEKSVAGIDASLVPVAALTKPERVTAILQEAGDLAFDRARALIFIASGCAAVLVVLLAVMLRWSLRGKV